MALRTLRAVPTRKISPSFYRQVNVLLLRKSTGAQYLPFIQGSTSSENFQHPHQLRCPGQWLPNRFMYWFIYVAFSSLVLSSQFANSLDLTVRGGKSSEKVAQLSLFINEDSSWVSLRLSYLISSRADLYSGSFIADGYLFQSSTSNTIKFYYSVPNWTPTTITVFSATQISGIRTYLSQPLSLTLLPP